MGPARPQEAPLREFTLDRMPPGNREGVSGVFRIPIGILREYGARRVFLFGSMARGDARPGSNVDLACEGLPPGRFFEAWGKLLLFAGREVDLVDLSEVKEPLRRCIEEGVLLYEAE